MIDDNDQTNLLKPQPMPPQDVLVLGFVIGFTVCTVVFCVAAHYIP